MSVVLGKADVRSCSELTISERTGSIGSAVCAGARVMLCAWLMRLARVDWTAAASVGAAVAKEARELKTSPGIWLCSASAELIRLANVDCAPWMSVAVGKAEVKDAIEPSTELRASLGALVAAESRREVALASKSLTAD